MTDIVERLETIERAARVRDGEVRSVKTYNEIMEVVDDG